MRVYLAVSAMTLLAALLRFPWLDRLPPGLYHDEAYNGVDALSVSEGQHAIFFPANNGREPLHIYLMSLTVGLFGRTPLGVRAAGALLGTLLIPLTFALSKEMFGKQVGLWAVCMATPLIWLLCLSRTGFRAGSLPVVSAAGLTALWRGQRTGERRWFALAGALIGATQYTYTSARFVPVALGLGMLLTWRHWRGLSRHLFLLLICMTLVVMPLAAYALSHRQVFLTRTHQLFILNPDIHQGRLLALLGDQLIQHLKSLFLVGDPYPRHNVPGKPMLDPVAALLFITGLFVGLASRTSLTSLTRSRLTFSLIWIATMFLPGILAKGSPGFLRLSAVLPLLLFPPALGAHWLWRRLRTSGKPIVAWLLPATIAAVGMRNVLTYYTYFTQNDMAFYHFEVPSTEIAAYINQFLGHGYTRDDLPSLPPPSGLPRSVYAADELLNFSKSVIFLLQPDPRIHTLAEAHTVDDATASQEERLLMVVPSNETSYLHLLPPERQIQVYIGSATQGEHPDAQPFRPHLIYTATRPPNLTPMARFEAGISLLDYHVEQPQAGILEVQLRWYAHSAPEQDYTVFVHLLRGDNLVSQHDGPPACEYYPTNRWREGDVIVDTHRLAIPPGHDIAQGTLRVGLYRPEDLTRLPCTLADGQIQDSFPLEMSDDSHP